MGQIRCEICFVLVDEDYSTEQDDWHEGGSVETRTALVVLFKDSGKFYTEESWQIPKGAVGPWDMRRSVDFRRIGNGAVLVMGEDVWGFPHLILPSPAQTPEDRSGSSEGRGDTRARGTHPSEQDAPALSVVEGTESAWSPSEDGLPGYVHDPIDCPHNWPPELYGHSTCTKCGLQYDQYAYIPPV